MTRITATIQKKGNGDPVQFDGFLVTWKGEECIKYKTQGERVTLIRTNARWNPLNGTHVILPVPLNEEDSFTVPSEEIASLNS
jgi:hypothetical protein